MCSKRGGGALRSVGGRERAGDRDLYLYTRRLLSIQVWAGRDGGGACVRAAKKVHQTLQTHTPVDVEANVIQGCRRPWVARIVVVGPSSLSTQASRDTSPSSLLCRPGAWGLGEAGAKMGAGVHCHRSLSSLPRTKETPATDARRLRARQSQLHRPPGIWAHIQTLSLPLTISTTKITTSSTQLNARSECRRRVKRERETKLNERRQGLQRAGHLQRSHAAGS